MSERFVLVLLAGVIPLFFMGSYPAAFTYLVIFNGLAGGAWYWDRKKIQHKLLLCSRECPAKWLVGQPARLMLTFTSESGFPMEVGLHESIPRTVLPGKLDPPVPVARELDLGGAKELALIALGVGLPGGGDPEAYAVVKRRPEGEVVEVEEELPGAPTITLNLPLALTPQRLTLKPYRSVRICYALTPTTQGPLKLGKLTVRMMGPLGLAWTQQVRSLPDEVEVAGNLTVSENFDAADRKQINPDAGPTSSRRKGGGFELESLREYVPGDEFRKIAWKSTARRGKTVVKQTVEDISQSIIILLDAGRRLGIAQSKTLLESETMPQGQQPLRLNLGVDAVVKLSRAALKQGHRVGFVWFQDRVMNTLKPKGGPKQWTAIRHELARISPSQVPSNYEAAASFVAASVRQRSLVLLITEPPAIENGSLERALLILHGRHRTALITLQDPSLASELDGAVSHPDRIYLRNAAADLLEQRATALKPLTEKGIPVLDVPPAGLTLAALNRALEATSRRV